MRELSSALLAAQKQASASPCVQVKASNKSFGALKYKWTRLYTGTETEYLHGLALPGDGSLIRVRLTPVSDNRKLYRQRVANPGEESDFSQWTDTGQSDVLAVAAAALGADVTIVYIKANREIRLLKSTDNGANWGSPLLVSYTASTLVYGLAAAYKPDGDFALFYADQSSLYVKKCTGGQWQSSSVWDKSTGDLSGVGAVYDGDWCLLVSGKDTAGNFRLWSLVYGDGGDVAAGTWSDLEVVASSPAGGDFSFTRPFLDKTDVLRGFFVENFSGVQAYCRPFRTHLVDGTSCYQGLWREPSPFNLSSQYGLAIAHHGDYAWLASPSGVWRSPSSLQTLDVTNDVVKISQETGRTDGTLTVELNNEDGGYAFPAQDELEILDRGCRLEFSPGYLTAGGKEYSQGCYYHLESYEHLRSGGKSILVIKARDGWNALENWQARYQMRWNKSSGTESVEDILSVVLARAGLKLNVLTQSSLIGSFCPDFTVNPGNDGKNVVRKLLGFVPDRLFFEGDTAFLVNPQADDSPVYSYGAGHAVLESVFRTGAMSVNRVQAEGWDDSGGSMIIVDSCAWDEIDSLGDRLRHITDKNLGTVAEAVQRGEALLRQAEIDMASAVMTVPVNCGQQLYDVVAVTDASAGLNAALKRVTDITLVYRPSRGEYLQRLGLGKV